MNRTTHIVLDALGSSNRHDGEAFIESPDKSERLELILSNTEIVSVPVYLVTEMNMGSVDGTNFEIVLFAPTSFVIRIQGRYITALFQALQAQRISTLMLSPVTGVQRSEAAQERPTITYLEYTPVQRWQDVLVPNSGQPTS